MSFNSTYKIPLPSSRLTEIRQNRMLYANYISKIQANNQGCDTARTGMEDGNVAPGSIVPDLLDGARNTTSAERDRILASTACPVTAAAAPAPAPPEPVVKILTDGLMLYYDAGITSSYSGSGTSIFDLSPNGYTGTLINGITFDSANGGSLIFNGINNYIDTNQSLGAENFTVNAWIKNNDVDDYRMILSKETADGVPWNYRMWLNITDGYLTGDIAKSGQSGTARNVQNMADGQWHLATFSRNSTTNLLKLYVDGVISQTDTQVITGSIVNSQEVWIGLSAYLGGSYPYTGNIGSIFLYDKTQTDAEILSNFNATKTRFGV